MTDGLHKRPTPPPTNSPSANTPTPRTNVRTIRPRNDPPTPGRSYQSFSSRQALENDRRQPWVYCPQRDVARARAVPRESARGARTSLRLPIPPYLLRLIPDSGGRSRNLHLYRVLVLKQQ